MTTEKSNVDSNPEKGVRNNKVDGVSSNATSNSLY